MREIPVTDNYRKETKKTEKKTATNYFSKFDIETAILTFKCANGLEFLHILSYS